MLYLGIDQDKRQLTALRGAPDEEADGRAQRHPQESTKAQPGASAADQRVCCPPWTGWR